MVCLRCGALVGPLPALPTPSSDICVRRLLWLAIGVARRRSRRKNRPEDTMELPSPALAPRASPGLHQTSVFRAHSWLQLFGSTWTMCTTRPRFPQYLRGSLHQIPWPCPLRPPITSRRGLSRLATASPTLQPRRHTGARDRRPHKLRTFQPGGAAHAQETVLSSLSARQSAPACAWMCACV